MGKLFYAVFKTARPQRWVRNMSLYAALVFTGELMNPTKFLQVAWATVIFSLLSSTVYFFNDLVDAPLDRQHPFKKKRPIASGLIALPTAVFITVMGLFISLLLQMQLFSY